MLKNVECLIFRINVECRTKEINFLLLRFAATQNFPQFNRFIFQSLSVENPLMFHSHSLLQRMFR